MDATNVAKLINMGGTQEMFDHFATTYHDRYPDRFVMFMKPTSTPWRSQECRQVRWIDDAARRARSASARNQQKPGRRFAIRR
jgi:hypothetical protein